MMVVRKISSLLFLALACFLTTPETKVIVHVVPHTHDDVGWLKTVDEYYTGQNNSIQHAYVKMILDTVIESLQHNSERTFTYVEQAFFQRWWRQQSPALQRVTKRLVESGQLSFTNGGWCMHDEAAPFYLDMIDQTTLGHRFLMNEFGVAPSTGWQLDPFGHSATQAALLSAEVGFAGLFFGRIDYQDLDERVKNSAAEFVWRASPSLGPDAQVFAGLTGSYGGNYGPPTGFNWDAVDGNDEPVQDDRNLKDYNVKSRVDDFVNAAMWQANHTRGDHIMFTMGSDFQYENAREWYENLDRIIRYVNEDGRVEAMYSTPEKYLHAKANEKSITWPLKTDDFFPYADGAHQFWTGYFTSRPALKRYVRDSSAFLQIMKHIRVVGGAVLPAMDDAGLEKLAEAMGVAQHHDAVAGTAKQHVTFDYAARIAAGRSSALPGAADALAKLSGVEASKLPAFSYCVLRNVSVCGQTQRVADLGSDAKELDFLLWNGLAQARTEVVELPTGAGSVRVLTADGQEIPSQIVPTLPSVTNYGQDAGGSHQAVVFSADVPAFGFRAFRLVGAGLSSPQPAAKHSQLGIDTLENEFIALKFCNGSLCRMTDKTSGISIRAEQSWLWYQGSTGGEGSSQQSGAYIFRPNHTKASPVFVGRPSLRFVLGDIANEVHQTFGPWVSQRIRLRKGAKHAEVTYTVGPIPVGDGFGKEVVSRITTDIQNHGECLTDSNGREMIVRKRDFRQTWKLNQTEPVAGNYYPVTSALAIRDAHAQLTVLTDATQGGTGCVRDGELELMVHRALLKDDGRGVGEPLNETEFVTPYVTSSSPGGQHFGPGLVVRGQHLLTLSLPANAAEVWRPAADRLYMPLAPFFSETGAKIMRSSFSAVQPLPANVQIISLEQWDADKVLLRLAHQFGLGEDATLSKPAAVDLGSLFLGSRVVEVDERGLAATISRAEVTNRRIAWHVDGESAKPSSHALHAGDKNLTITLGPLQIRTFLLKLSRVSDSDSAMFV
eukprot:TRINITY_DN1122_c3_g1_i1.p1 TRINITY_DN1122_c3_g1~~TRINITY_DN1122_c3_g1_i1.p1  ORF type:complete len:1002 (-),score=168.48 TRINITY_DN1122_c3_g1_i1:36-3041(-)